MLPVMFLISVVLGIVPLAGIAWMVLQGTITTVDGLFLSLILLLLSGIFFLDALWDLRDRGFLPFLRADKGLPARSKIPASPGQPPASNAK